jgi:hypothetical protein
VVRPAYLEKPSTPLEIARLLHAAEHELAHASDPAADLGSRARSGARAALRLSALVLRASGFETEPPLDPELTFGALPDLVEPEGRSLGRSFHSYYRKIQERGVAPDSPKEKRALGRLLAEAGQFRDAIVEWLATTRRHLVG